MSTYVYQVHTVIPSFFSSPEKAAKHAWAVLAPKDFSDARSFAHFGELAQITQQNSLRNHFIESVKSALRKGEACLGTWEFAGEVITKHEVR